MTSIEQILLAQGDLAGQARRVRGGQWAPLIQHLSNLPAQIAADRQASHDAQEAAFDRAQQRNVRQQTLDAGQRQQTQAEATEAQKRQMNDVLASEGVLGPDQSFNVQRAQEVARQKGYRDIFDDILDIGSEWNEARSQQQLRAAQAGSADRANQPSPPSDYTLGDSRYSGQTNQPLATAPAKPPALTFGALTNAMVNGRRTLVRTRSDGVVVDIKGNVVPDAQPDVPPSTSNGDPGPLETIIGPDGKPRRVLRRDAVGQAPASGTEKASSGVQKRVLNFFNRAQQADVDLESMEEAVAGLNFAQQQYMQWAPNFAQTQLGQQYIQAQRTFTEARLRKDSGATIKEEELAIDRQTFFAQPGDSKETLAQKRRARAATLAGLGFESGQALGEYVGDAEEAKRIVDRYKARASRPGAPASDPTDALLDELLRGAP